MKALSIKQPWAWLIVNGLKDIENRNWPTRFTGEFLVHTGKNRDNIFIGNFKYLLGKEDFEKLVMEWDKMDFGGIVGKATILDCVSSHSSKWFVGDWGFVLCKASPLNFVATKGQLGFFDVKL